MEKYQNIPKTGFNSLQPEFTVKTVDASMKISDTIALSLFSIYQIVAGVRHAKDILAATGMLGLANYRLDVVNVLNVAGMLFEVGLTPNPEKDKDFVVTLQVLRGDVETMKSLLKLRMAHCEKQRDDRHPHFNPDTYIGQKLLLIELSEWLMLETVEAFPAPGKRDQQAVG